VHFPGSNFTEKFTAVFSIAFGASIWLASGRMGYGLGLLAINAGIASIALFMLPRIRNARNPVTAFWGIALPLLLFYIFYRETALALQSPDICWLDSFVSRFETKLWRAGRGNPVPWLGELLAFSYMSYVPLLVGATLILMSDSRSQAGTNVRRICLAWAVCYVISLICPVLGPRFIYPDLQASRLGSGIFSHLTQFNQQHNQLRGAAFPSAHVAATTAAFMSLWTWKRSWFWILLPLEAGLVIGAVYLGYHYIADIVAGLATGILVVLLDRLFLKPADSGKQPVQPRSAGRHDSIERTSADEASLC
jgi:membrane-associated phospholipid phosphatase